MPDMPGDGKIGRSQKLMCTLQSALARSAESQTYVFDRTEKHPIPICARKTVSA